MPITTVVMADNGLSSQNQDYLPSRFLLQKETIEGIVTQILERDQEGFIGIVPIAQLTKNDILTPTRNKTSISAFIDECDLQCKTDIFRSLFQVEQSLNIKNTQDKSLIIFLCSPIESVDELIACIYSVAAKSTDIKLVCYGDALELGVLLKKEINFDNFQCLAVRPADDFHAVVGEFLDTSIDDYDPELKQAIMQSLAE